MQLSPANLEIRPVASNDSDALARFFGDLRLAGVEQFFHPHPLTLEAATLRASYAGRDVYLVVFDGQEIVAYGMLRGWDEGYSIPSLGIAVRPDRQGCGLGRRLMHALHKAAIERGAQTVRLRVSSQNRTAINLYLSLGYQFEHDSDGTTLIGYRKLS